MDRARPIILILGPTAGGKTRLAIDLARTLPGGGECVCADSMQVYRGMNIGTAKPTEQEQAEAPHHLIDIADPADDGFSVDRWLDLVEKAIEQVRSRGRFPIVVGGTNLYIQALLEGLFEGPQPDQDLRERLGAMDGQELRQWLMRVDSASAERIHPNDRKRTIRAIEVFEQTGRPISELQQQWQAGSARDDILIVGLDWPAEEINRRINARVREMIERGLVEEVRGLWEDGLLGVQAREALGYKQIIEHLEGRCPLAEAVEQVKIRTRRYAKQQRTWLRRFKAKGNSIWLEAGQESPQDLVQQAVTFIDSQLSPHPRSASGGG
ncbi:MAG: tRNA (adenosine(37)-N6)-dimethylallyltransferase MiaA [Phycisphaerales bacterium]|nr:MAG: tRNA (adenosine(37)-N6)-dimethylallyltransferase MiaA [Phycisphaerales bacterium]